jgi:hypothetical protein
MYGENVTMQNFIYRVLEGKIFIYKLKILEEIKCLYNNFKLISVSRLSEEHQL